MRILIVEEALKNFNGHWYEYNKSIVDDLRSRGHIVTLLAHQDIEDQIKLRLAAVPFFNATSWDGIYNHSRAWRRYIGIIHHNLLVAWLMAKFFLKEKTVYDIVLVPTVVLYHWIAWRWLLIAGAGRWFRRLVLFIRNNAGEYDCIKKSYVFPDSARVTALVISSFKRPIKNGFVQLATDSHRLASQYCNLCGVPVATYPHPRSPLYVASELRSNTGGIVYSALGPPRYEKGSDLVISAINKVLLENPHFPGCFVVHWSNTVYKPSGEEILIPGNLLNHPKVRFIWDSLSSSDYYQALASSDVILLPYRRAQYYARLSGIAIESFQEGVSCICVEDTWIADCMRMIGAGLAIQDETVDALSEGINEMLEHKSMTHKRMLEARSMHCPAAFIDQLLEFAQSAAR